MILTKTQRVIILVLVITTVLSFVYNQYMTHTVPQQFISPFNYPGKGL